MPLQSCKNSQMTTFLNTFNPLAFLFKHFLIELKSQPFVGLKSIDEFQNPFIKLTKLTLSEKCLSVGVSRERH